MLRLKIFDPNISNRAQILLRGRRPPPPACGRVNRPQAYPRGGTLRAPLVLEKHKVVGQNFRDRALVRRHSDIEGVLLPIVGVDRPLLTGMRPHAIRPAILELSDHTIPAPGEPQFVALPGRCTLSPVVKVGSVPTLTAADDPDPDMLQLPAQRAVDQLELQLMRPATHASVDDHANRKQRGSRAEPAKR